MSLIYKTCLYFAIDKLQHNLYAKVITNPKYDNKPLANHRSDRVGEKEVIDVYYFQIRKFI